MPTPAPTPDHLLAHFVEHLPLYARRLIVLGEPMPKTVEKREWMHLYVETLIDHGWTPHHIESFFLSHLPFDSIKVFRKKYKNHRQSMLQKTIQRICPEHRHALHEALVTHPGLTLEDKPALHRLATFAQQLYEGTQSRSYLAALPIGSGKTTQFLIPFVTHCMKHTPGKGIIVAMERRRDVKKYAASVNLAFADPVAYALFSHDPDPDNGCPENCRKSHPEWKPQAKHYPLLFCTHEMLSRGVGQYQQWDKGERVLAIIDEKPTAWWGKGSIAKQDLDLLREHTKEGTTVHEALHEALNTLQIAKHEDPIQLQVKLNEGQVHALRGRLDAAKSLSEKKKNRLQYTLDSLFALGQSGGVMARGTDEETGEKYRDGQILVSRRRSLPHVPTIILDGTGEYDPEYSNDIVRLDIDPWGGIIPPRKQLHIVTWDRNLAKKHALKNWKHLQRDIDGLGATPVYIVSAKQNEDAIREKLETQEDWEHFPYVLAHYGNTKGRNDFRHTAAIAFTSVQFKGDPYYQAIANDTGKGVIPTTAKTVSRKNRQYVNPILQTIKVRDTACTLAQEIGRTRLRENEATDLAILLPWCDETGVSVLIHQLIDQFQATVTHEQRQVRAEARRTQGERLIALLTPGAMLTRQDIIECVGTDAKDKRQALSQLLSDARTDLWAREIDWEEEDPITVPKETQTQARIALARKHLTNESTVPLVAAA